MCDLYIFEAMFRWFKEMIKSQNDKTEKKDRLIFECIIIIAWWSIFVVRISVGFFETGSSTCEKSFSQWNTNFRLWGVFLYTWNEFTKFCWTFSFDDFHSWSVKIFSWESYVNKIVTQYPLIQAMCFFFWLLRSCMICFTFDCWIKKQKYYQFI